VDAGAEMKHRRGKEILTMKRTAILSSTALVVILSALPVLAAPRTVLAEMFGASW
jgi:hypothetical protein